MLTLALTYVEKEPRIKSERCAPNKHKGFIDMKTHTDVNRQKSDDDKQLKQKEKSQNVRAQ